jgi:hypothetical protein
MKKANTKGEFMSVPLSEVAKLVGQGELTTVLPCSFCEKEKVFFRAEDDATEGRKPVQVLSGHAWEISNALRAKLSPAIKFLPGGKLTACHDCATQRTAEVVEKLIASEEPGIIHSVCHIAFAARPAA